MARPMAFFYSWIRRAVTRKCRRRIRKRRSKIPASGFGQRDTTLALGNLDDAERVVSHQGMVGCVARTESENLSIQSFRQIPE